MPPTTEPSFNVKFDYAKVREADRIEVWGTSFNDPGPDFCEFRLLKDSTVTQTVKLNTRLAPNDMP